MKTSTIKRQQKPCPGADSAFKDWCHLTVGSRPALSRYGHGSLCTACGMSEALSGDFITASKIATSF